MRKTWISSALVGAILFAQSINTPAQTAAWKQYTYSDDGFQASYPSPPDLQKKSVQTSAGEFELRSYAAAAGRHRAHHWRLRLRTCRGGKKLRSDVAGSKEQHPVQFSLAPAERKERSLSAQILACSLKRRTPQRTLLCECSWSRPPSTRRS